MLMSWREERSLRVDHNWQNIFDIHLEMGQRCFVHSVKVFHLSPANGTKVSTAWSDSTGQTCQSKSPIMLMPGSLSATQFSWSQSRLFQNETPWAWAFVGLHATECGMVFLKHWPHSFFSCRNIYWLVVLTILTDHHYYPDMTSSQPLFQVVGFALFSTSLLYLLLILFMLLSARSPSEML